MVDGPGGPRDDEQVSEPVLGWLDEIAEAEDLSREKALEYLVSSYWRLEEIVDLLEADEDRSAADEAAPPSPTPDDRPDLDGLHERFDHLLEALRRREAAGDDGGELLDSILELGDRIAELEAELDTESAEGSPPAGELRDRIEALEAELAERSAPADEPAEQVGDYVERLASVESDLAALEARFGDAVTEETMNAVIDQTRSFQDSITRQHDSLRDRVHTEFDHIRTILDHLLDTTSTNEARTERLVDEFEGRFRAHLDDRETLAAITRTANRRGVHAADCDHCGQTVDLSLLKTPECPSCEHTFTDLETATGLFGLFPSGTLMVEGASNR